MGGFGFGQGFFGQYSVGGDAPDETPFGRTHALLARADTSQAFEAEAQTSQALAASVNLVEG